MLALAGSISYYQGKCVIFAFYVRDLVKKYTKQYSENKYKYFDNGV